MTESRKPDSELLPTNTLIEGCSNPRLTDRHLHDVLVDGEALRKGFGGAQNELDEEKCLRWLCDLIKKSPEGNPKPMPEYVAKAEEDYGIKRNKFYKILPKAKDLVPGNGWSRSGRRAKNNSYGKSS